jgi:hypothetical protein
MNAPRIIELGLAAVLLEHGEMGAETSVRPWRSLASTKTDQSRVLPCVDIRCTAAQHDEDQATQSCLCDITIITSGAGDADHSQITAIEDSVRDTLERLYDQTKSGAGDEYATFIASAAEESDGLFILGGFRFNGGSAPIDDDDSNVLTISITADFAKSGG